MYSYKTNKPLLGALEMTPLDKRDNCSVLLTGGTVRINFDHLVTQLREDNLKPMQATTALLQTNSNPFLQLPN